MPLPRAAGARLSYAPAALGLLAVIGTLAACQDPSGVGLGLIGEEGNDPNLVVVLPGSLGLEGEEDVTGGYADGSLPPQVRVLVGAVADPVFGDARAEGYLDVRPPTTVPSGFRDRTITSATLRLVRDYVYGDSTAVLDVDLHEVAADWDPVGAAADTAFEVGDLLDTYEVAASDSVVSLGLPEAWVDENDELLRSDSVTAALDGFRLRLTEGAPGGAVVGFDAAASRLRLTTEEDTVDYPLREVFTHLERGDAMPAPTDRLYLRDGAGEVLAFALPYDTLGEVAVARAAFRLSVDPSLLDDGPFEGSLPEELVLYGVPESGPRVALADAEYDDDDEAYYFSSNALTNTVQDAVLGPSVYTRYEVEPARSPVSLAVLPLVMGPPPGDEEAERRPRLVLTVIPATD